jgi:hypothetical protein
MLSTKWKKAQLYTSCYIDASAQMQLAHFAPSFPWFYVVSRGFTAEFHLVSAVPYWQMSILH